MKRYSTSDDINRLSTPEGKFKPEIIVYALPGRGASSDVVSGLSAFGPASHFGLEAEDWNVDMYELALDRGSIDCKLVRNVLQVVVASGYEIASAVLDGVFDGPESLKSKWASGKTYALMSSHGGFDCELDKPGREADAWHKTVKGHFESS